MRGLSSRRLAASQGKGVIGEETKTKRRQRTQTEDRVSGEEAKTRRRQKKRRRQKTEKTDEEKKHYDRSQGLRGRRRKTED